MTVVYHDFRKKAQPDLTTLHYLVNEWAFAAAHARRPAPLPIAAEKMVRPSVLLRIRIARDQAR
jgi:hypothetical protein